MGGREEYAALGGSDGGRAPPRDLDFRAFQPRACDIAERSGISFEIELERSFESGCAESKRSNGVREFLRTPFPSGNEGPFLDSTNPTFC